MCRCYILALILRILNKQRNNRQHTPCFYYRIQTGFIEDNDAITIMETNWMKSTK